MKGRLLFLIFVLGVMFSAVAQDSTWTLEKCIQYAIANNISLKQTELNSSTSEVAYEQSKANRIPVVSGNASQGFSFGRSIDPFSNQFITQNIRSNNFNISGSLTLFNGFQIQNQIKQNRLNYEASLSDVATTKNNTLLAIAQYYYQILLAQEQVENARIQVLSSQAQIEKTKKQVDAGSVPEINLIQLQTQLANDNLTLINAKNQVYLGKVNLMQAMNLPLSDSFDIVVIPSDTSLIAPSILSKKSEEIYQTALGVQPSIKGLQLRKESSVMGLRAAKGGRYPRLSVNGQIYTGYSSARTLTVFEGYQQTAIGFLNSDPSQIVSTIQPVTTKTDYAFARQLNDNISESFNFSLSIPILNNRQVRSNIDRASINLKIAELQEQSGKIQLRQNIEQAYANMIASHSAFKSSEESMGLQEQTYLNSERRFNLGMMSPYDYIIQKNNYYRSIVGYSQSKYQYIFNAKVLEFYQTNQF